MDLSFPCSPPPPCCPADMAVGLGPLLAEATASPEERRLLLGPGLTNLGEAGKGESKQWGRSRLGKRPAKAAHWMQMPAMPPQKRCLSCPALRLQSMRTARR